MAVFVQLVVVMVVMVVMGWAPSYLHVQDLVEYGLGQAFSHVLLVHSMHQPVPVLFVRDDPPAPGDLKGGHHDVSNDVQAGR